MMDPSTEFGSMMQTAMKIKGHQMEQDRRRFETWPQFFQNSMWMQGPALELRLLPRTRLLELEDPRALHLLPGDLGFELGHVVALHVNLVLLVGQPVALLGDLHLLHLH